MQAEAGKESKLATPHFKDTSVTAFFHN